MRRTIGLAGLVLAAACPAQAQPARERATVLMAENPAAREQQEIAGYADAVVIDGTAYLSGVVAAHAGGGETLEASYERAFDRLGRILVRAGAGWGDVVDITTFHTDLTTQIGPITRVKARHLKAPFPAWTAIGVTRLSTPRASPRSS